jgi:hypothetical protein
MLFHTSPRCNNGTLIHIHSGKFALYYTLFSDDVLRLKSVISRVCELLLVCSLLRKEGQS